MSELSWLIDLLINHKLSAKTKAHVIERIGYVETIVNTKPYVPFQTSGFMTHPVIGPSNSIINGAQQSPSTIAAMQKHDGVIAATLAQVSNPNIENHQPGIIAATPQTAAALQARNQSIELAMSGKPEKGRTSPRKF